MLSRMTVLRFLGKGTLWGIVFMLRFLFFVFNLGRLRGSIDIFSNRLVFSICIMIVGIVFI